MSLVSREAIISLGRPTLLWDMYFLFVKAAWHMLSPFLEIILSNWTVSTTVQSRNSHHVCGSRSIEHLAEWLKSRQESGGNTLILRYLYFGRLFQFLGSILVLKCSSRTGNRDSISEIDLILMFWCECVEHRTDFPEQIARNRMLGTECPEWNVRNGMPRMDA